MSFSVDPYLGRTYDRRTYHCWHLFADAWLDLTGDNLSGPSAKLDTLLGRWDGTYFQQVPEPVSPCAVLMLRPPAVPHVGLFHKGRVLHIRAEGARHDRLPDAVLGFDEVRFYAKRHADPKPAGPGLVGA
jgi:hypothetical protein